MSLESKVIEKRLRYNLHQRINALKCVSQKSFSFVKARIRNKGNFLFVFEKKNCKVHLQIKGSRKTTCWTFDTFDCNVKLRFYVETGV